MNGGYPQGARPETGHFRLASADSTIRVFSSDLCGLHAARRMSFMTCAAGAVFVTGFFVIRTAMRGQDEPQNPRSAITPDCSVGADGGHP